MLERLAPAPERTRTARDRAARSYASGTAQPLQRARGSVRVAFNRSDVTGLARLATLHQSGSAKCMLPRVSGPTPEAVLLNTAGGITGGDVFDIEASVSGAALMVTSQTAERIYRSAEGSGRVRNRLKVEAGGRLDWLPQETILFDGGRLDRRLDIDMADDASLWAVESLVLGRTAMGETVKTGFVSDQWRIRRAGKLVYADGLRLGQDDRPNTDPTAIDQLCRRKSITDGGLALATLIHVSHHAEDMLPRARALITEWMASQTAHIRMSASAWNGLLSLRLVAETGRALRTALAFLLTELRGAPLPRVWSL